jgi:hypothetical protein
MMLVCAGVIVIVTIVVWPREREPEYQGKTLTEWVGEYEVGCLIGYGDTNAASEAVNRIGTNGLPWLVKWIAQESGDWKRNFSRTARIRVTGRVTAYTQMAIFRSLEAADIKAETAVSGFEILREAASPATPELVSLMRYRSRTVSQRAIRALLAMGQNGVAPVLATITNELAHLTVRCDAAYYLALEPGDSPVMDVLVRCLEDAKAPTDIHYGCIIALNWIGPQASNAVPALVGMLRHPADFIREETTNALRNIAPELLATNHVSDAVNN